VKVIFIEYVHRHLARYGCEVRRDRRYVCPRCGTRVTDLATVRKRFEAGKDFITCQSCDKRVPLIDFIEQRLKSDPVARKILGMEETATRQLDAQALEQILIGHMQAITGEANQIFRQLPKSDHGIVGEIEFKDNDGRPSGKKVYVVFHVTNGRHFDYWISQPADVYLVVRQTDERANEQAIRWMNITRYLKSRRPWQSRQIVFEGEPLTMEAVWRLRDEFFPRQRAQKR